MCGIAGFINAEPIGCDLALLKRMTDAIQYRGPDDSGFYRDEWAALGHRRLSIIDLSGGHQPMSNETGSMWIIYNGEIFNHASLRPELERNAHRYRSHCDTETILHSYEEYGPDVEILEDIQDSRRIGWIRAVVEAQRERLGAGVTGLLEVIA